MGVADHLGALARCDQGFSDQDRADRAITFIEVDLVVAVHRSEVFGICAGLASTDY
jgi:hypothetical protein